LATGDAITATSSSEDNMTSVLSLIVDAFYRVRFGGESLPDVERMSLEASLVRIEKVLVETRSK
jgi:hypothetical protein